MTLEDALNEKVPTANATAYGTGIGNVRVYVDPKTNKTQASGFLPGKGVTVVPDGSKYGWKITGVNPDGTYQSEKVDINTGGITSGGGGITLPGATTTVGMQSVESMYGKRYNDMVRGQNALTNIAVNQLESQKKGVHSAYDASARNAYTNYMMNNKELNESLIRSGLSEGGMSESSQVASNAAYGAELMQNEASRNQAISDIDSQIADVRYQGEAAKLKAKDSIIADKIDYMEKKEIREQDREWENEDRADDNYHDYQKTALSTLKSLASMGITEPPKQLLNALGLTPEQYNQMLKYYEQ